MALNSPTQRFERFCRLCAEEQNDAIMIFSEKAEAMLLKNKLSKYLQIEVEDSDILPKNICINCCSKLHLVCDFIDNVHKAQEVLEKLIVIPKLEPEEPTPITSIEEELVDKPLLENPDDHSKMEVNVDPLIVVQNSDDDISGSYEPEPITKDVTYMYGVDVENVSIKLIRKDGENPDEGPQLFVCNMCKRSFRTELGLKNHSWTHVNGHKAAKEPYQKYKCGTCSEGFVLRRDLVLHLKDHKSDGICQLCGRMFRSEKTYVAHMAVHFSSQKSYTCKVCGRSYSNWSNLRTHSITHSSERPHQCTYCKKAFKRKMDLKFHVNQHTGNKPYKCPYCDKSFTSSGNCYAHKTRMHPGKVTEGNSKRWTVKEGDRADKETDDNTPQKTANKYQCHLCDQTFLKRDNFNFHVYQHTGEKPFQCTFCPEAFFTRRVLLLHHGKKHPEQKRPLALLTKNILLK